jgi:uncharacterized membrane protein YqaE (UPF0057 family)
MPPFGIMLSKGMYGWFSILVCVLLTYMHYLAGIIYAFVITMHNRYADQYEQYQIKKFEQEYNQEEVDQDLNAFFSSLAFIVILIMVFVLFIVYI